MIYIIGEKVKLVDNIGTYTIIELNSYRAVLEDNIGFTYDVMIEKLIKISDTNKYNVDFNDIDDKLVLNRSNKHKKQDNKYKIIDIHIENIIDDHSKMNNTEILFFQLDYCKKKLDEYYAKNIYNIKIIHGVGKGKLKDEVRLLLNKYLRWDYMDDILSSNGVGATKVYKKIKNK